MEAVGRVTTQLVLRSSVSAAVLEDGAVLLDLDTKYFYAINASGWAILQILESGGSQHDVEVQCRLWGAPDDGAVGRFVEALSAYGLLETQAEGQSKPPLVSYGAPWVTPTIERQAEPLQNVIVSAFDPTIPLAE